MRHPEFPVVSFLCFFVLLLLSPTHIKTGSIPTMSLIAWMAVMSLIRGVNSLVWAGNFDVKLQVWCDITTKLTVGFGFAIPGAALCILRHLENIVAVRHAQILKSERRRRQKIEVLICFGVPILFMALHYIVQGHRFDLFEDYGCLPATYVSVPAMCLIFIPPIIISLTSFFYAAKSLRHILHHRMQFANHIRSHAGISSGRYFRLMALAITVMLWDTGINAYVIWINANVGLLPYKSWGDVHSGFSRILLVPTIFVKPYLEKQLLFQWWILPISCLLFSIFFGFGTDAMSNYRSGIYWFRRTVLRQNIRKPRSDSSSGLPSYSSGTSSGVSGISVILPSITSDNMSEVKAWDALSLEMPECLESSETPSPSTPTSKDPLSPSLDDHSLPMVTPEYPSYHRGCPLLSPHSTGNRNQSGPHETPPAVIITKPSNAALRDDVSPATATRAASRQSMPTDFGITVSPAFFSSEPGFSAPDQEETFQARDSRSAAPVLHTPVRGIQITVEKCQT